MYEKYIRPFFQYLFRSCRSGIATVRALSWPEVRDLFLFAHRRLREESLPQVAGSLTFTTVFALVPLLTIALAIFTTFPLFNSFRSSLEAGPMIGLLLCAAQVAVALGFLREWFADVASRTSG